MEYERPKGFYGVVVKTQNAVYAGKKGTLVWDYIIWNEISFVEDNTNKSESLFKSLSDSETEAKFAELSRVYGVKERTGAKNDNVEKKTEEDHKPGSLISRAEDFLNGKMNKKENREEYRKLLNEIENALLDFPKDDSLRDIYMRLTDL